MVDKIFVISAQKNLESYELIRLCSCYLCLCSCCLCLCLCVNGMQFVRNVGFHLSGHCVHHRPEQVSFPCLANGQIKFDQPRIIQHSFFKNVFSYFGFRETKSKLLMKKTQPGPVKLTFLFKFSLDW